VPPIVVVVIKVLLGFTDRTDQEVGLRVSKYSPTSRVND
jgi:hypothetical protein